VKKFLVILTVFALLVGKIYAQQLNLDTVIERSARAVEEVLPQGAKVAVLNFVSTSETFSDHVIEELTGKLVNGRKVTIVDRRNLALISQEMNLQLSGDVSDESAQAIGRMLGAQSIVSGTLTNMGTFYRFRVRVINVETAAIQSQASYDLRNDEQVAFLLGGSSASTPPIVSGGTTPSVTTSTIEGTIVPGNNLTEKLAWLQRSADSHNTYIVVVNANENIAPHVFEFRGAINITIVLRGDNVNRTVRLRSHGRMFSIRPNVTFILDNNITLNGHNGNDNALVFIEGGTFRMNFGATITGNTNIGYSGGGVYIGSGTFEMTGGTISGNTSRHTGGGVVIIDGNFIMTGGTISGNTAGDGSVSSPSSISSSRGANRGGGVSVWGGTFTMRGGNITGNIAHEAGAGVFFRSGTFNKSGGIITGYNSDSNNGNVVRDIAGNIIARNGHAVFVNENLRKETTAGTGVNLSNRDTGRWD